MSEQKHKTMTNMALFFTMCGKLLHSYTHIDGKRPHRKFSQILTYVNGKAILGPDGEAWQFYINTPDGD